MNAKIRDAQMQKIPYVLVVGDREMEDGTVALRMRSGARPGAMSVGDFVALAQKAVAREGAGVAILNAGRWRLPSTCINRPC